MSTKSSNKKFVTICGNRPQLIKLSAIELENNIIVHTGAHYDNSMSGQFLDEFQIEPDYNLNVGSGTHGYQVGEMVKKIEEVLLKEKPDTVIVYGDTNSTLAGALAASKLNIPIAHIEAGLRCYDKTMPEEQNRVLVDHLSTYLFCPTQLSVNNLKKEGLRGIWTGDVMADLVKGKAEPQDYVLATIHRPSNTDNKERLEQLLDYCKMWGLVIFPMHPRTKKMVEKFNLDLTGLNIIEPVGFKAMLELERKAKLILTDSGGVQREAYLLGVPYIVLRDTTEWPDLVTGEAGLLGENASAKIKEILCTR